MSNDATEEGIERGDRLWKKINIEPKSVQKSPNNNKYVFNKVNSQCILNFLQQLHCKAESDRKISIDSESSIVSVRDITYSDISTPKLCKINSSEKMLIKMLIDMLKSVHVSVKKQIYDLTIHFKSMFNKLEDHMKILRDKHQRQIEIMSEKIYKLQNQKFISRTKVISLKDNYKISQSKQINLSNQNLHNFHKKYQKVNFPHLQSHSNSEMPKVLSESKHKINNINPTTQIATTPTNRKFQRKQYADKVSINNQSLYRKQNSKQALKIITPKSIENHFMFTSHSTCNASSCTSSNSSITPQSYIDPNVSSSWFKSPQFQKIHHKINRSDKI